MKSEIYYINGGTVSVEFPDDCIVDCYGSPYYGWTIEVKRKRGKRRKR